jgi:hypothetical protein
LIEEVLAKVSVIMDLTPDLFANSIDDYSRDLQLAKWGSGVSLHGSNPDPLMSALGQKQTSRHLQPMSALPPKADMDQHRSDVGFVQIGDMSRSAVSQPNSFAELSSTFLISKLRATAMKRED